MYWADSNKEITADSGFVVRFVVKIPMGELMKALLPGHSDGKITLNRYVHLAMESKRKQIGALFDFYGRICGQAA